MKRTDQNGWPASTTPLLVAVLCALGAVRADAQDYSGYTGKQLFAQFCASCHGALGRGDGPVGPSLKVQVPDLTRLIRKVGEPFPSAQVRRIVDGREVPAAHGARRMPVWGYEFASATTAEPDAGSASAAATVDRLVEYLKTLQRSANNAPASVPIAPMPSEPGAKTP